MPLFYIEKISRKRESSLKGFDIRIKPFFRLIFNGRNYGLFVIVVVSLAEHFSMVCVSNLCSYYVVIIGVRALAHNLNLVLDMF